MKTQVQGRKMFQEEEKGNFTEIDIQNSVVVSLKVIYIYIYLQVQRN